MEDFIYKAANIKPSERQMAWQETEFYSFIHFSVNTFTDKEWGLGDEDPSIFNPAEFNADQWVDVCKSAGMKGLILTCKHHDGFCLWPSKYTEHSVKNSPWKGGKGDIVAEVSNACRRGGIKFGVYLSPWDRHEITYGTYLYNHFFTNQLRELLTEYGELFCVWFDGACGEGKNGKRQIYDWDAYYSLIRKFQPDAVISICGPDVRWCGNEAGICRESEWSVVPSHLRDVEKIHDESQKADDGNFTKKIDNCDKDLGSRKIIEKAEELIWYPAEVDTSIRPGWFYHAHEDDKVRSLEELLKIYYSCVGGNSNLLLNLPPDRRGLIHENDAARMRELGQTLRNAFNRNLAEAATMEASETMDGGHDASCVSDGNKETYWCPCEGTDTASLEIDLCQEYLLDKIVISEYIRIGQRVERFTLEYKDGVHWKNLYAGTTIGYKKICCFEQVNARYLRLKILESRWYPTISSFEVYGS